MSTFNSTDPQRVNVSGVRHKYRELTAAERDAVDALKNAGQRFWDIVEAQAIERAGQARSYALAKTKVEEAVMWAVHGVTSPEGVFGSTEGKQGADE